eukprot:CAMPEP_0197907668 /NCGR_PEP_ID=MMETSP1439-20131203/65264_1 /TAXON_ID=66791 /ORGANISM="Gonyaulax spinifera, Strain CCMP409" /LENGTH=47 /DNA_ID= /DNA_START= /DNA_END= /DNA_ORIENTATION=
MAVPCTARHLRVVAAVALSPAMSLGQSAKADQHPARAEEHMSFMDSI